MLKNLKKWLKSSMLKKKSLGGPWAQSVYSVVSWYLDLPHLPADSSDTLLSAPDPRNVLYWQHLDEAEANMADLWRRNLYESAK